MLRTAVVLCGHLLIGVRSAGSSTDRAYEYVECKEDPKSTFPELMLDGVAASGLPAMHSDFLNVPDAKSDDRPCNVWRRGHIEIKDNHLEV